jgi:hypothetical protein
MGILDEAIRNHLDLKRRHGAAEDDLKRLEDEAFGPPTRPGEPDFPEQEANGEPEAGDGEAEAPRAEELPAAEHGRAEPETELSLADLDLELDAEDAGVEEELATELDEDEFAELGEPEAPRDRSEPEAAIESLPTEEHPAELDPDEADPEDEDEDEDEEEEEEDEEDEDVLADTPEFLRDAPEDDELWFEQGKPKDFDFDEE